METPLIVLIVGAAAAYLARTCAAKWRSALQAEQCSGNCDGCSCGKRKQPISPTATQCLAPDPLERETP